MTWEEYKPASHLLHRAVRTDRQDEAGLSAFSTTQTLNGQYLKQNTCLSYTALLPSLVIPRETPESQDLQSFTLTLFAHKRLKKPVCRKLPAACCQQCQAPGLSPRQEALLRTSPRLGTRQEGGLGWRNKPGTPRSTKLCWADNLGHSRLHGGRAV